jgi:hypothetical protein
MALILKIFQTQIGTVYATMVWMLVNAACYYQKVCVSFCVGGGCLGIFQDTLSELVTRCSLPGFNCLSILQRYR